MTLIWLLIYSFFSVYFNGGRPKSVINGFVNGEINLSDKRFDLDGLLLTKKEVTLIVDGLDELDFEESKKLLAHLLNLSHSIVNIRIVASGRPIELKELVHFNQWNCLTTLDLTENEIIKLLQNEAVAGGIVETEAKKDGLQRWEILKSKQELLANATTPLIVCLIRDFLDENLSSKTLGDILYEVLKRRLDWHKADQKENFSTFFGAYPHTLQREKFIAPIAYRLYISKNGKINEDTLFQVVDSESLLPKDTPNREILVNETINFFKSNFLQKIGDNYAFQSHQLHQLAVGLHLYKAISSGEEFQFKGDRFNSWREISYAAAIARTKGESRSIEQYLGEIVDELVFTNDKTPATAVLLAEAQISALNSKFFEKVKFLGFRPLKFWGSSDSLVPHAYAFIIKDLGEVGFDWFFDDYLNPKHPTASGHDELAVLILQYYLLRSQCAITENAKSKLGSIIPFHLAAGTYWCNTLLPTISLALPDNFEVNKRCILLTDALRNSMVREKAKELLRKELSRGEKEAVVNALEIACRNKDYQPQNALELWFEVVDGDIPKIILDNCISLIGKGEIDFFPILKERIGEANLLGYCRFNILNQSDISDAAAIILYQYYGEKDPFLVGEPILKKSSYFDYKNVQREKVLNEIIYNTKKGEEYIIRSIPHFDDRSRVSELYLKYFLVSLEKSDNLYINEFLLIVRNLNKFSLTRYPEIREGFTNVLSNREYYNALKESLEHLDAYLRYNSASILLVCNPENENEALEIIIRSVSNRLDDNRELLRLCMKLNFSTSMLDYIYELLDDLTDISKAFALKLLYHNNEYKLTNKLLGELVTGLLGEASFLDNSGYLLGDGIEQVIGKGKFYDFVRNDLNSDQLRIKELAAICLLSDYANKLDIREKAYCWLLYIQYNEYALVDFNDRFQELFEDTEFIQELRKKGKEIEETYELENLLFLKYYEAIKENGSWNDFFLALLKNKRYTDIHRLENLYGFVIQIGSSNPSVKEGMGKSIKEIMAYPTISQERQHNFLLPQLAVFAHEFGELNNLELGEILDEYQISQEEIACALLYRLGEIPEDFYSERRNIEHISVFATNPITPFYPVSIDDLNILLEDGEDIPDSLELTMESVLLKDTITYEDLLSISEKGSLGTYFSIVIRFSRYPKMELQNFIKAEDIGSFKYFARERTQHYKSILFKIKEILVSDDSWKESYIDMLVNNITDKAKSKDIIDLFKELFILKDDFDSKLLPILFEELLQVPYRCNLDLVYWINEYVINLDIIKLRQLIKPLKTILKAVNNYGHERHENEMELMSWSLSLILLYAEKKVDEDIERGFLTGLRNIFIKSSKPSYAGENQTKVQFRGRDLFIKSNLIIKKIDRKLFHDIINKGIDSNIPEIRSVCAMFSVFGYEKQNPF